MTSRPGAVGRKAPRCVICGREETPENPIYPALAVYLRASRPIPVCHECLTAEVQEAEPASIEDAA